MTSKAPRAAPPPHPPSGSLLAFSDSDVPIPRRERLRLWERIMPFIGRRTAKDPGGSGLRKAKIPSKPERVSELDGRYKEAEKKYGGGWAMPPHLAR